MSETQLMERRHVGARFPTPVLDRRKPSFEKITNGHSRSRQQSRQHSSSPYE
ncbi:MAG: ssDNA endonuclease and repair protein rad10 [Chaenotheca gracillima]|nr:MAG: ssDNA endonuclease and repair protein rad10 [Chaenotheca gracillima]